MLGCDCPSCLGEGILNRRIPEELVLEVFSSVIRGEEPMAGAYGYAGKILRVDLSSGEIGEFPTTDYADAFLGGRGIAAALYWDEVPPDTGAFDPENRLIFMTGPLAGVAGLAGSRWTICGKSPATDPELFCYSNLGGRWGAKLKFSGFDGIVIQGSSRKPVYLYIDEGRAELKDASPLWGKGAAEAREMLKGDLGKSTGVVATGPAGENAVTFASLLADDDSSGSSGFGAVMGSKKLKAIAVRGKGKAAVADPERLGELRELIRKLGGGSLTTMVVSPDVKPFVCFGCTTGCVRSVYKGGGGKVGKVLCQSGLFYQSRPPEDFIQPRGKSTSVTDWDEGAFDANRLCDDYGLDTNALEVMINWLTRCHQEGIISEEETGIPLSKVGSQEFIETLVKKIAAREGFGDILARGSLKAAGEMGKTAREILDEYTIRAGQDTAYDPRLYITTGLLYATEARQPIACLHEIFNPALNWLLSSYNLPGSYTSGEVIRNMARRFWGSEEAADFSTYQGKAQAARRIQDRQYSNECLILCNFAWPLMLVEDSEDHIGDPGVESQVLSAVTGIDIDEDGLYSVGERVFNLQRAIHAREGRAGREGDELPEAFHSRPIQAAYFNPGCLVPGKDGEQLSRMGQVVDREEFEKMKDEYYELRGWDVASGLQSKEKLEELDMSEVAEDLASRDLVV
jgi:aldehyde:ferredoxin oxidoreductase